MTKQFAALFSVGAAWALCGCGDAMDSAQFDETGSIEQELGEASCALATPDAFMGGSSGFTPVIYSNPNCFKAFVFDLGHVPPTPPLRQPPTLSPTYSIRVEWADPWPRTQAQCRTILQVLPIVNGALEPTLTARSVWENGACKLGVIDLSAVKNAGSGFYTVGAAWINGESNPEAYPYLGNVNLKLAVTARTAGNTTQGVHVSYFSNEPPSIPCPGC